MENNKKRFETPITIILKNLYTNRSCDWIEETDESVQPFVIQRWLAMNDMVRVQSRWLDKYVFHLPIKMYLSLAWSVLPKTDKVPFIRYIKKVNEVEEFDFIFSKIRKHLKLSDNDFNATKGRLLNAIKENMVEWFSAYGVPKKFWKQYQLNFNQIKNYGPKRVSPQKGLGAWGL